MLRDPRPGEPPPTKGFEVEACSHCGATRAWRNECVTLARARVAPGQSVPFVSPAMGLNIRHLVFP